MNQMQLNAVAMNLIQNQSAEVAEKIGDLLHEDAKKRAKLISGPPLHYIHNAALFECLVILNSFCMVKNHTEQAAKEYTRFAETLKPKFLELVEALKDFQLTGKDANDE